MTAADHWEAIYSRRPDSTLSWYEREPTCSLRLIERTRAAHSAAVIDVGAGTSTLVDRLLDRGYTNVTVLDISTRALADVSRRLGQRSHVVAFVRHDVLTWQPAQRYEIWHDRAVFHFLTKPADQDRYIHLAGDAVCAGGWLLLATFAPGGPARCSGLPVSRYSAEDIAETFSPAFELVENVREDHLTPKGIVQPFTWVRLKHIYGA